MKIEDLRTPINENKLAEKVLNLWHSDHAKIHVNTYDWSSIIVDGFEFNMRSEKKDKILLYLASRFRRKATANLKLAKNVIKKHNDSIVSKAAIRAIINASDIEPSLLT
jgi:hypothetical protein